VSRKNGSVGDNKSVQTTTVASNTIDLRYRTDGILPGTDLAS
jgi:hypothetical protein